MPRRVRALDVTEDERVAGIEPLVGELERPRRSAAASSVSGSSRASSPTAAPRPRRKAELATNVPRSPCRCSNVGHVARPAPPLQRDHVEALALEPPHHLAAPLLRRPRGALRLGHERLRAQHGMPVAEERVAVGDALIRAAGDAQNRLAAPDVLQREGQAVDRDAVAARDEPLRLLGVAVRIGASRSATSRRRAARPAAAPRRRRRARRSRPARARAPRRRRGPGNSSGL